MKKNIRIFNRLELGIASFLLLLSLGCQTTKDLNSDENKKSEITAITVQKWEAKISDLKKDESRMVYLQVFKKNVIESNKSENMLRIEVTGALNTRVASVLIDPNQISYALHLQKKYFTGPSSSASLKPMLGIEIEPTVLIEKLTEKSREKEFSISTKDYRIDAVSLSDETIVQPKANLFQLETPKNYRTYNLK